jgi:hypothetical protein
VLSDKAAGPGDQHGFRSPGFHRGTSAGRQRSPFLILAGIIRGSPLGITNRGLALPANDRKGFGKQPKMNPRDQPWRQAFLDICRTLFAL